MPYFCPYCAEVFLASAKPSALPYPEAVGFGNDIHRHECPECGYFLTQQLEEI